MLTLSAARTALAEYAPADKLTARINLAAQRLIDSGRWKGTVQRAALAVPPGGIFALPPYFETILAVRKEGRARTIANGWYEFLPGVGDFGMQHLLLCEDRGYFGKEKAFVDPLQFYAMSDSSATVRFTGRDATGAAIELTVNTDDYTEEMEPDPVPPQRFKVLTGVEILGVAEDEVVVTGCIDYMMSVFEKTYPVGSAGGTGETVCRHYFLHENKDTLTPDTIIARVKRSYVAAAADTDPIFPTHLGALANAMQAIHFEKEGDLSRADAHFNLAIKLLNAELRATRAPGEQPGLRVLHLGEAAGSIPALY